MIQMVDPKSIKIYSIESGEMVHVGDFEIEAADLEENSLMVKSPTIEGSFKMTSTDEFLVVWREILIRMYLLDHRRN